MRTVHEEIPPDQPDPHRPRAATLARDTEEGRLRIARELERLWSHFGTVSGLDGGQRPA